MIESILKGEIYYASLDPKIGSEQGGTRPVLIIQNDIGNQYSPTTIVAALTTNIHNKHPLTTHMFVSARLGLKSDSIVLLEQVRTIDRIRLLSKIAYLSLDEMNIANEKLLISLGINL